MLIVNINTDVFSLALQMKTDETALHVTTKEGNEVVANTLLERGVMIDAQDSVGYFTITIMYSTILHIVFCNCYWMLGHLLLNIQHGDTALHIAAQHSHRAIVELLVKRGCNVDLQNKVCCG